MNIRVFMASALALAAIASSANALTITAMDNVAYTVKVMPKGAKEIDLAIKANGSADVDCKAGLPAFASTARPTLSTAPSADFHPGRQSSYVTGEKSSLNP